MSKRFQARLITWLTVLLVVTLSAPGWAARPAQDTFPQDRAKALLEKLTPEERVGQLFLVAFNGPEAAPGTPDANQIYNLVTKYHIGGVILLSGNDNFAGYDQTLAVLQSLTDQIQRNDYSVSLIPQTIPGSSQTYYPSFIPLFIAIIQDGDGFPYDNILNGLTPLPSNMTIGATWEPQQAQQIGAVLGKELSILGINMLLGPSLDVLEPPYSETSSDIGVRSFGGDPFWVAELGRAFIRGVHQGSGNKIAVVAKHFPGFGGADRLPEEEVPTIRKTLDQLRHFDLYPFFMVTGNAESQEEMTDGLLASPIRYQGFQENFRATTKPISFDPQAFGKLMELPALKSWRESGGVVISNDLGSRAVRRFYDPTGETFNGRAVALDAFLAGNDILYLGNFISSGDPDRYTSIVRTIESFIAKYKEDPIFAERVDQSVLRILTLKYRLYPSVFSLNSTLPRSERLKEVNASGNVTFETVRKAATLISPPLAELEPAIPAVNDQIVFLTDMRTYQQCSLCPLQNLIELNALEQTVVRLYGPQAGSKILPRNLVSYSFQELQNLLNVGTGQLQIENDLRHAEWIVFSMLDNNPAYAGTRTFENFLNERPDLIQGKRLIAFAFNAPYFLDATDISKLTAYYGIYNRTPQAIDVAARLLFQEILPVGDLPVSVQEVGYDLARITFPDPNQEIQLFLDLPSEAEDLDAATPQVTATPVPFRVGDPVPVRTGVILDHNGHVVPDGTIVTFILTVGSDVGLMQQVDAQTEKGIARATLRISNFGAVEIRAKSEPAMNSQVLQFVIPSENLPPTERPTIEPSPTATASPTPTLTASPTATPTPVPILPEPARTGFLDWLGSLAATALVAMIGYRFAASSGQLRWGVRNGYLALIGGILAYSYLALQLPGSSDLIERNGFWGVTMVALLGAMFGGGCALIWRLLTVLVKRR